MGLEKAIKSGKEHRKEYRGAKAVDKTCRNHGSCSYCLENRTHKYRVAKDKLLQRERDFARSDDDEWLYRELEFLKSPAYDEWLEEEEEYIKFCCGLPSTYS